ncbi:hypothetical protein ACRAWD_09760 [Caulobacter segnis]
MGAPLNLQILALMGSPTCPRRTRFDDVRRVKVPDAARGLLLERGFACRRLGARLDAGQRPAAGRTAASPTTTTRIMPDESAPPFPGVVEGPDRPEGRRPLESWWSAALGDKLTQPLPGRLLREAVKTCCRTPFFDALAVIPEPIALRPPSHPGRQPPCRRRHRAASWAATSSIPLPPRDDRPTSVNDALGATYNAGRCPAVLVSSFGCTEEAEVEDSWAADLVLIHRLLDVPQALHLACWPLAPRQLNTPRAL